MSLFLHVSLHSSTNDADDAHHSHDRGEGATAQDDGRDVRVGQREARERDQMGHEVEGRSVVPGDPQPERDDDNTEQLYGHTEPGDPQAEADVYRDVPERQDLRQRGAQRPV